MNLLIYTYIDYIIYIYSNIEFNKMSTNHKKIKIAISQVAPLIGLDHYNNFPKIVCELWRKYDRQTFNNLEKEYQNKNVDIATDSDARRMVRNDKKHGTNIYQQVKHINKKRKLSTDITTEQNVVINQIKNNLSIKEEEKQKIIKSVTSSTNKMHGVKNEDSVLEMFQKSTGMKLVNGQGWINYPISNTSNIEWSITGKYDGLTECNTIVEAKKRQKKLFKSLRDYENIQIQCYMLGLGLDKACLVESYSNSKGTECNIINVDFDKVYASNVIMERLKKFCDFFEEFINNTKWQEEMVLGDVNRNLYNLYCKDYLML